MSGSKPARSNRRVRPWPVVVAGMLLLLIAGCGQGDEPENSTADIEVTVLETTSLAPRDPGSTSVLPTPTSSPSPWPTPVGTPVPTALASGTTGHVTLAGYLVIDDGSARLCELLLDLEPPACGGMSVSVRGSVDHPELHASGSVRWSAAQVDLSGNFTGSVLQADSPPAG